jgi:hypothetical protein
LFPWKAPVSYLAWAKNNKSLFKIPCHVIPEFLFKNPKKPFLMKNLKTLFLFVLVGLALTSCEVFEPDHSIRITNKYPETINHLTIGIASYGNVASGETTGYESVETGSSTVSGTTESGASVSGSVSISGAGAHKWTVTITSSGTFEIKED